jgi:prevent-host-death family protein
MRTMNVTDLRANLAAVLDQVADDAEEVVITRDGHPLVRLVPVARRFDFEAIHGVWRGQVRIADDFDELPDDLAVALGAR